MRSKSMSATHRTVEANSNLICGRGNDLVFDHCCRKFHNRSEWRSTFFVIRERRKHVFIHVDQEDQRIFQRCLLLGEQTRPKRVSARNLTRWRKGRTSTHSYIESHRPARSLHRRWQKRSPSCSPRHRRRHRFLGNCLPLRELEPEC